MSIGEVSKKNREWLSGSPFLRNKWVELLRLTVGYCLFTFPSRYVFNNRSVGLIHDPLFSSLAILNCSLKSWCFIPNYSYKFRVERERRKWLIHAPICVILSPQIGDRLKKIEISSFLTAIIMICDCNNNSHLVNNRCVKEIEAMHRWWRSNE